jgi:hypothetical protein
MKPEHYLRVEISQQKSGSLENSLIKDYYMSLEEAIHQSWYHNIIV